MALRSDNMFLVLSKREQAGEAFAQDLALIAMAALTPSDTLDMCKILGQTHVKHMIILLDGKSFISKIRPAARDYLRHVL